MLSPLIKRWLREAHGQSSKTQRLVLFTQGNGIRYEHLHLDAPTETSFDLTGTIYESLAKYQSRFTLLSKFYNAFDKALHGNQFATLSVMPSDNQEGEKRGPPGRQSIDRLIAGATGNNDPFKQLLFALKESGQKPLIVSADGKNQPVPAYTNPFEAFTSIFGATQPGGEPQFTPEQLLAQDQSLLSLIREDVERTRSRLAGPEKAKLDQYMSSLESLEKQIVSAAQGRLNCQDVPAPDLTGVDEGTYENARLDPAVIHAHVDLAASALACGLTRNTHNSILGMEGPHDGYRWLGNTVGHHNAHHDGKLDELLAIDKYTMSELARMADHLAAVPEGGGTMLDNSLIVYINTCGAKHHGGHDHHFVIMIGNAGGAVKTGRVLTQEDPTYKGDGKKRCIADYFVSLAQAFGVDIASFGDPHHNQGPLSDLA